MRRIQREQQQEERRAEAAERRAYKKAREEQIFERRHRGFQHECTLHDWALVTVARDRIVSHEVGHLAAMLTLGIEYRE